VKEKPEDFVVREILPKDDAKISKVLSHCNTIANGTPSTSEGDGDSVVDNNDNQLSVATMPSGPPIRLPSNSDESSNRLKNNPTECKTVDEQPRKKTIVGEKIPSLVAKPMKAATAVSESSVGDVLVLPEPSLEDTIRMYIEKVATPEHPASALLKSIDALNVKATNHIPTCQTDASDGTNNECPGDTEVWIPPLYLSGKNDEKDSQTNTNGVETATDQAITDAEIRGQRKAFHRAIRIFYPFLKTGSSACSPHSNNDGSSKSTALQASNENQNKNTNGDHWIKITIDDCFDELVNYLCTPRDDLRQLFLFRNWGFEGAPPQSTSTGIHSIKQTISFVVLRLRSGVTKDDRRKVHHILALKNKHFESSIRNQEPKKKKHSKPIPKEKEENNEPTSTDLVVKWKKQALRKGSNKNKKRKRFENGKDGSSESRSDQNLLCVLKKTQKEHLTTMQILSRSLRCRQADIGFAGIKDMQAITYQFITLRNMGQNRAERAMHRQLPRDVELKILCSNVDFHLNIGDLKGNQFEITVRNLKRVKVDLVPHCNGSDSLELAKESFIDCESEHIDGMVERIKQHGFINFYGEQRIGAPGNSEEVGVRAFEIGRAMLRQDFMGAIKLLMEGTRHHETDEVRRVRQSWKDSNGDPSITLKAFGKADIMPRERAVLRGLNRYPDTPLEAIRFLNYNMRMFYINAYQSYIFNRVASRRVKLYGGTSVKGDLYFEKDGNHRDNIKVVQGNEVPHIAISQVVLPLPGYNVQYPTNEIGQFYRDLLETDNVKFEKNAVPEATANGSYRKLIVHPGNLSAVTGSSDSTCGRMNLSFQLPKGCYATMLLRELMLTTVVRSKN
jgi:tRNA pseudouridine13 synthase